MASKRYRSIPLHWMLLDYIEQGAVLIWPLRHRRTLGRLLLLPAVLLVGVLVIGLGYMVESSFHELDLATYRLKNEYSIENYSTLVDRPVYLRVLAKTLLAAIIVTIVTLILAFPYAYMLVRSGSALTRKILLVSLFLPFFIGQVVRAYGWLIILGKEGLINTVLTSLGLPSMNLLYTYSAVIFGLIQYMLPFAVLLIIPAITSISEELELASESLGANWVQTFRHVVVPMARPGLVGAAVVVFTLTMTDFAMPEILGGGTSDFIASAIYDNFFQISHPGLAAALSIILVAVGSLIVTIMFMIAGTGTLGIHRND